MDEIDRVIAGLTEAQKRMVLSARFKKRDGAWCPEGWYAGGDKRVRWALKRADLTTGYLRDSNRLTPLGLAVRARLQERPK